MLTGLQLTREYANLQKSPPPYITAHPSESNILEYGLDPISAMFANHAPDGTTS